MADKVTAEKAHKYRWFVVTNLTNNVQDIVSERYPQPGAPPDMIIQPRDSAVVRSGGPWEDDYNLETAVAEGKVITYLDDSRPKPFPALPRTAELTDPRYNAMLREMVIGREDIAKDYILAEPLQINRAGMPVDREWLKTTGWKILNSALAWLKAWGPPASEQWRVEMIKARLEEIRLMP